MVRPFGLIEMMRTGEIAISRGRSETVSRRRRRSRGCRPASARPFALDGSRAASGSRARLELALRARAAQRRARRWRRSRCRCRRASTRAPSCAPRAAPGEPWFVFEQPDRGRAALAGARRGGQRSRPPARSASRAVAERWRALSAAAVARLARGPATAAGPIAVGGFAFAPDGGASPHWAGFEPASLIVPRSRSRATERGGERHACASRWPRCAAPDDTARGAARRACSERLGELRERAAAAARPGTRPGASRSPARCRPSTTRRRSRARSS